MSEKLDRFISKSEILYQSGCSEENANDFYKWVFDIKTVDKTYSYFGEQIQNHEKSIIASVHRDKAYGAIMLNIPNGKLKIHKKLWLKFTLQTNLQPPFDIKWIVENDGDEAKAVPDLGHESWDYNCYKQTNTHWERTAYQGIHTLNAEIYKNGIKVEMQTFEVKIIK